MWEVVGGGSFRLWIMQTRSSPSSRLARMFALTPGRPDRRSEKRRPPNISSRTIRSDQRSPTSSRARAVPQASSYQRFLRALFAGVIFCDFIVAFYNVQAYASQAQSR